MFQGLARGEPLKLSLGVARVDGRLAVSLRTRGGRVVVVVAVVVVAVDVVDAVVVDIVVVGRRR